jgi:hypothetical protein
MKTKSSLQAQQELKDSQLLAITRTTVDNILRSATAAAWLSD